MGILDVSFLAAVEDHDSLRGQEQVGREKGEGNPFEADRRLETTGKRTWNTHPSGRTIVVGIVVVVFKAVSRARNF